MDKNTRGIVYLLHYESPYHHAQHYLGWTNTLKKRIAEHREGDRNRCVITSVFAEQGIPFKVARIWRGTLALEKKLKRQRNNKRLCPICKAAD